jgi:ankyrin repeat protein
VVKLSLRLSAALLPLFLLAACERGGTPPPAPTPTAAWKVTTPPPGKIAMRMEEPRKAQPFTLEQRLLAAVSSNDRTTIERALAKGVPLTTKDDLQRSVVVLATLDAGDLELVRWLHGQGAALDEADVGGRTALSFAAEAGRLDLVRYLVDNGAAVDRGDVQRRTPLFHASLGDHPEVVVFLLDRGADIDVRDQFGDTPLIVACAKGNPTTAAVLLRRGADATVKDQEGRTARERADATSEVCRTPSHVP